MRNAKIMTKSSVFTLKLVRLSMSVQAKSKERRKPQLSEVLYLFSLQKFECFAWLGSIV